jgi:hypothetical protein
VCGAISRTFARGNRGHAKKIAKFRSFSCVYRRLTSFWVISGGGGGGACLGRLGTLERLRTASATVAEEALAEKTGAG